MKARSWYNEIDPQKAAWLRELIREGHIADGIVDETSIERIRPVDIASFTQCHFFAGIGVWSHALRSAGWSDDTPVWTGSCPCQSFSASGKREGFSDQRHLWPAWFRLIRELRPERIFGEQVASNDGLAWFDIVSSDMEGEGYSIGACDTCAAGFGAPHIRQRLYFVAESLHAERRTLYGYREDGCDRLDARRQETHGQLGARGEICRLADAASGGIRTGLCDSGEAGIRKVESANGGCTGELGHSAIWSETFYGKPGEGARQREPIGGSGISSVLGHSTSGGCGERGHEAFAGRGGYIDGASHALGRLADADGRDTSSEWIQRSGEYGLIAQDSRVGGMAHSDSERRQQDAGSSPGDEETDGRARRNGREPDGDYIASGYGEDRRPGPVNGFWRDSDWLLCTDGKWWPVRPGSFPLAHGSPARVGRLRGYGDGIVAPQAAAFVRAWMGHRA